jgi:hypothetical protein
MNTYEYTISLRIRNPVSTLEKEYEKLIFEEGIEKSRLNIVGTERLDPKGNSLGNKYRESVFSLSFINNWMSQDELQFEDALNQCIEKLEPYRSILLKNIENGGSMDFFIGLSIGNNGGISIEPDLLKKLADLHIELGFDIYSKNKE